ncbi:MAG: EAL domain-containing protein [Holophagaceae bacterium]|nr:EAL domain-containing protein [Holophagaceae bacterium]
MPFSELKIDQAALKEAQEQDRSRTLVEVALELARRLDLRIVAERVETRSDWEAAEASGWDEAQGFFISRPLPGHQIPDWAAAWRAQGTTS